MLLEINKSTGKVITSEGLENFKNENHISKNEFLDGGVYFDTVVFDVRDNILNFVSIPACPQTEIYFSEFNSSIIFSDSLFKICDFSEENELDESAITFFLKKSYSPGGKTFFRNIKRLYPASVYGFLKSNFIQEKIHYIFSDDLEKSSEYSRFIEKFERICISESEGKKVGVLFSGGADSLAIALTLEKLNIPFILYTGEICPSMKENWSDLDKASSISKLKNWKHVVVKINYNEHEFKDLHDVIGVMPNASHLSLIFLNIMAKMKADGVNVCFSGQNLDNLYNFGATASLGLNRASIIDLARRYFLSEYYFSTLSRPLYLKPFSQAISYVLLLGYCAMRRSLKFRLPTSRIELFNSFINSADNTVFIQKSVQNVPLTYNKKIESDSELRSELVRSRVESYLASGDSLSIINTAKLNGIKAVLPYSAEPMIPFFLCLKTSIKDIFIPKKIIHQIIKNNMSVNNEKGTKPSRLLPGYHQWAKNIFPETKFAQSISKHDACDKLELATPALKLSCQFANAWKNFVVNKVKSGKSV